MLEVLSLEDARALTRERFLHAVGSETVSLADAGGRVLACDIAAVEGIPPFTRSTMDGYAVLAGDTFGSSESIPALVTEVGEISMGAVPDFALAPSTCARISTGGMLPDGADAVVMVEHTEQYGDGTVGILKAVAPGDNLVMKWDEFAPGDTLVSQGALLGPHEVGTLASLGIGSVSVFARPRVAVISTGDEIVPYTEDPHAAQMRDVNAPLLGTAVRACGGVPHFFGIVPDEREALRSVIAQARETCDLVLVSGGSSAGQRDNTAAVFSEFGELLFHGIAVKPGKPTICADLEGVPALGLPGHPAAAYFIFMEVVQPVLERLAGRKPARQKGVVARTVEAIPSNHGRAECLPVVLEGELPDMPVAHVKHSKSGLISQFLGCDGYLVVPRESEGLPAGATVLVKPLLFH